MDFPILQALFMPPNVNSFSWWLKIIESIIQLNSTLDKGRKAAINSSLQFHKLRANLTPSAT